MEDDRKKRTEKSKTDAVNDLRRILGKLHAAGLRNLRLHEGGVLGASSSPASIVWPVTEAVDTYEGIVERTEDQVAVLVDPVFSGSAYYASMTYQITVPGTTDARTYRSIARAQSYAVPLKNDQKVVDRVISRVRDVETSRAKASADRRAEAAARAQKIDTEATLVGDAKARVSYDGETVSLRIDVSKTGPGAAKQIDAILERLRVQKVSP